MYVRVWSCGSAEDPERIQPDEVVQRYFRGLYDSMEALLLSSLYFSTRVRPLKRRFLKPATTLLFPFNSFRNLDHRTTRKSTEVGRRARH